MRIGILTSGGDAPGMNACVRSVVRTALFEGFEVFGIMRGYHGLVNDDIIELNARSVSDIIQRGGTVLHTARCPEFVTREGQEKAVANIKKYGLDAVVVIGGDGTFKGAKDLTVNFGIPTVGIPGTIDNDLAYTDYTIGFDTAVNTVINLINNLRDTMTSHERISVVEVMGRHCGDIALYAGVASGAEIILIPEIETKVEDFISKLEYSVQRGKKSNIVVVAEGVKNYPEIISAMQTSGLSIRETILGHIQRGGSPTMQDRILASQFGYYAVQLLKEGKVMRAVGIKDNKLIDIDIVELNDLVKEPNIQMYEMAKVLSS